MPSVRTCSQCSVQRHKQKLVLLTNYRENFGESLQDLSPNFYVLFVDCKSIIVTGQRGCIMCETACSYYCACSNVGAVQMFMDVYRCFQDVYLTFISVVKAQLVSVLGFHLILHHLPTGSLQDNKQRTYSNLEPWVDELQQQNTTSISTPVNKQEFETLIKLKS